MTDRCLSDFQREPCESLCLSNSRGGKNGNPTSYFWYCSHIFRRGAIAYGLTNEFLLVVILSGGAGLIGLVCIAAGLSLVMISEREVGEVVNVLLDLAGSGIGNRKR